ncbi:MAG: hypothetical protein LAO51_10535 [Acidobacteriia bacterium]|nr:hypothetical protein [Terriglobia bacterium]
MDRGMPRTGIVPTPTGKRITFYAKALNPVGRVGQLLITRDHGPDGRLISKTHEWTGIVYRDDREADRDITRLNCGG